MRERRPERWEKFCKANPQASEQVFVQKVVRELERAGTLEVLRHGFKVPGWRSTCAVSSLTTL
ncbi:hypothetical protein HSBAA_18520 [Vreelandella sulfidaeris]|uniref:Uncharacterized protein n=1 Tax=Vreelandella sulfidaeris TaxID=115553 RepID=A0A455U3F7_9GAMM|nr:hypothetical protein HSBAA_18520 [Halomonas sulfidaeris]